MPVVPRLLDRRSVRLEPKWYGFMGDAMTYDTIIIMGDV